MSGHGSEGSPPPEVPDEFAAAYRAAYERALAESAEEDAATPASHPRDDEDYPDLPPQHVTSVGSHRASHRGSDEHDAGVREDSGPVPAGLGPQHSAATTSTGDAGASRWEEWRSKPWFVPTLLLVVLVLVLVLGAYTVGRIVSAGVKDTKAPTSSPSVVLSESGSSSPSSSPSAKPSKSPSTHVWQGAVHPAAIQDAQATCTSPPGVDSAGHPVGYEASNTIDGDKATAWRCDGTAIGDRLVFRLPKATSIGQVALVPGYAKTDPASGADRYAENNRITRVRWILGDTSLEQTMSGNPSDRSLRTLRIPKTSTDRVTLQILAVARGPRNTTAISTVKLAATG